MTISQRLVVAVLTIALALIGVGRGLVLASDMQAPMTMEIDGIIVSICHSDAGDTTDAPGTAQHNCCDDCVLMAPTVLPSPPELAPPITIAYFVEHTHAMTWVPVLARIRTPRLSQGPPRA